jgi:hypothetical protein
MQQMQHMYPEACDYEFCKLLQDRGMVVPFAGEGLIGDPTLQRGRVTGFYGMLIGDMRQDTPRELELA